MFFGGANISACKLLNLNLAKRDDTMGKPR